jgi:hypothetical protein
LFGLRHFRFPSSFDIRVSSFSRVRTAKVFSRRNSGEDFAKGKVERIYGVGDVSAGDSVVSAGASGVPAGDSIVGAGVVASGVVAVVVGGLVAAGLAAGSVVSVFCSHAARRAALARMQMYFFIVLFERTLL